MTSRHPFIDSPFDAEAQLPLVSVLIRSSDRASLPQALDSAAAQSYGKLELVLVNVTGRPHTPLPPLWHGRPLRVVEPGGALPRAQAANALLDAAQGDWLLFLDDDDSLLPEHLARLVAALDARSDAVAAYAGVACLGPDGQPARAAYDRPFSRRQLLAGNFLPIHAVLFSRTRAAICRFDTTLDLFEDWDFWLQVSRLGNFVHVPGVSAIYNMGGEGSGVFEAGRDTVRSHAAVLSKWVASDALASVSVVEALSSLQGQVAHQQDVIVRSAACLAQQRTEQADALALQRAELVETLARQRQQFESSQAETASRHEVELWREQQAADCLRLQLDQGQDEIAAMRESHSWRLTRPLRDAGEAARRLRRRLSTNPFSAERGYGPLKRRVFGWLRTLYVLAPLPESIKLKLKARGLRLLARLFAAPAQSAAETAPARQAGSELMQTFVKGLHEANTLGAKQGEHVPYCEQGIDPNQLALRAIAYYLPQFHPIPENDAWWGKGFTEWTNVTRAQPQFLGHHQPKLPSDLGFYDLRVLDTMRKQAELARHYGLAGFCLYYYWFGGKRLLALPQQQILDNPDLDFPFCLCWANENWTRRWDGKESDVLMAQSHSPEDDLAMIADLHPAFTDPRYLRVDGKPIFLVYRAMQLPDPAATVVRWRQWCRDNGVGELYLVAVESFDQIDPRQYGFDATVEFPPLQANLVPVNARCDMLNEDFEGQVYDYREMRDFFAGRAEPPFRRHAGVAVNWDNEARKPGRGNIFVEATPAAYAGWLEQACRRTLAHSPEGERLVFINAWNEWAEGAYLEPDRRHGYAYLHATANVLRHFGQPGQAEAMLAESRTDFVKRADQAVVVHLFYLDLLDDLAAHLDALPFAADVFISVPQDIPVDWALRLRERLPHAYILPLPNRGRDIRPFYVLLPLIKQLGYRQACKLHSKKSPHRVDGARWRNQLWDGLIGTRAAARALAGFNAGETIGLFAPDASLTELADPEINLGNRPWLDRLLPRLHPGRAKGDYRLLFPAGSMFWFRPAALPSLAELGLSEDDFEVELGQLDGTLAHALERLFGLQALSSGYLVRELG